MNKDVTSLKERRKAQNKEVEREVHGIFRGRERAPEDNAIRGLELLDTKLQGDLEAQFGEVTSSGSPGSYADREVARLLRMLEKSKDVLDRLYDSMALDEDLMSRASTVVDGSLES